MCQSRGGRFGLHHVASGCVRGLPWLRVNWNSRREDELASFRKWVNFVRCSAVRAALGLPDRRGCRFGLHPVAPGCIRASSEVRVTEFSEEGANWLRFVNVHFCSERCWRRWACRFAWLQIRVASCCIGWKLGGERPPASPEKTRLPRAFSGPGG